MYRRIAVIGAVAVAAVGLAACHSGSQAAPEPAPARVTVTATPTPTQHAETPAEAAQWPTVDQTGQPSGEAGGGGAEPTDESNCGLTCPDAPGSPDWTTVPAPAEPVTSGPAMPDTTETPEVEGEGAYVAE